MREMAVPGVLYGSRVVKDWLGSLSISIGIRWVAEKSTPRFCTRVSLSMKEGICLRNSVISSQLGTYDGFGWEKEEVMCSNNSLLKWSRSMECLLSSWWAMSSAEGSFSSGSGVISAAIVKSTNTGARTEIGSEQAGSKQALFEGEWLKTMDSNKHLRCLSWNPALKFEAMSPSSSSSQTMRGTTRPTFVSGSLLGSEEDEDNENDEVDGEDGGAGGGVLALLVGRITSLFLFLVGSRTMELDVGR